MITKEEILESLHTSVTMVTFTKKDGNVRNMRCTLVPSYLPVKEEVVSENSTPKSPRTPSSTDSISVYDVENNGWRSFNLSNVISFTPEV